MNDKPQSHTIFLPAVSLINRLNYPLKFILITALFLIPMIYIGYQSMLQFNSGIEAANRELQGLQLVSATEALATKVSTSRGTTAVILSGDKSYQARSKQAVQDVNAALKTLVDTNNTLANPFALEKLLSEVESTWQSLSQGISSLTPTTNLEQHGALIAKLSSITLATVERSNLIADPELDMNYMINGLVLKLPTVTEMMAQTRDMGVDYSAGNFNVENHAVLTSFAADFLRYKQDLENHFETIYREDSKTKELLSDAAKNVDAALEAFNAVLNTDLLTEAGGTTTPDQLYKKSSKAIDAVNSMINTVIPVLDNRLTARLSKVESSRILILTLVTSFVLFAAYLFVGFYRSVMDSIRRLNNQIEFMAEGDLCNRVSLASKDELSLVADGINRMADRFATLVSGVISTTGTVVNASSQTTESVSQSLLGVQNQRAELEVVASSVHNMSASVQAVVGNAGEASAAAEKADSDVNAGLNIIGQAVSTITDLEQQMDEANTAITQLATKSESIGTVLDVIRGIAEQTNLLALNAAIEAARAGEQGRGFAVVADEVRTLASRTHESTQEIESMIGELQSGANHAVDAMKSGQQQTKVGVEHTRHAGDSLNAIAEAVSTIKGLNQQIVSATEEQNSVSAGINGAIANINSMAEETTQSVEATAQTIHDLKNSTERLQGDVRVFKVE